MDGEAPAEDAASRAEASSAAPPADLSREVSAFNDAIMSRALLPPTAPT
jgi:hypothetical protein